MFGKTESNRYTHNVRILRNLVKQKYLIECFDGTCRIPPL